MPTHDNDFEFEDINEIIDQCKELYVINGCGFDVVINQDGTLSLVDLEGANLAGIEQEVFRDYLDILGRIVDSYLHDYGFISRE